MDLLYRLDHIFHHLLGVAKHHHGFVHVEEFVVQTSITSRHAALVDNDRFGFVGFSNRHAVNGATFNVSRRIDNVISS